MDKAVVIDGNHCVHRIWNTKSGQNLKSSDGTSTGVLHGFLVSLCSIAKTFKTNDITVVWDHRSSYRSKLIEKYNEKILPKSGTKNEIEAAPPFYKASRYTARTEGDHSAFHEELLPQMKDLQIIIPKMGIRQLTVKGVEGDDLIGIAVTKLSNAAEVIIVSSDHDLWQLLDSDVKLYDPIRRKFFTHNDFVAKFSLPPAKLPEIRALSGDPKDDIPGVPRIGEKTAAKLIVEYGSLSDLFDQAVSAPKNAVMSTIPNYARQIDLAYDLSWIMDSEAELEEDQRTSFAAQWDGIQDPDWYYVQTFVDNYELKKAWSLIVENFAANELDVSSFEELWEVWGDCNRCPLHKTRTNIVKYGGSEKSNVFLLGEGPGASEDFYGSPFVGKAGKYMRRECFEPNGLSYDDFHIGNVVCCRPPENRDPTRDEIAACRPRLNAQVKLVNPKVVVLIGDKALKTFFPDSGKISYERGNIFEHVAWPGIQFVPVFHPSYLGRLAKTHSDVVKSKGDWKMIAELANAA